MNRRRFLAKSLTSTFGIVTFGSYNPLFANSGEDPGTTIKNTESDLVERLTRILGQDAHIVGEEFLQQLGHEPSSKNIELMIASELEVFSTDLSDRELRASIKHRIRQDFKDSRIVIIDGWYLSITEVTLSALLSLNI